MIRGLADVREDTLDRGGVRAQTGQVIGDARLCVGDLLLDRCGVRGGTGEAGFASMYYYGQ
jgi:hypothetical protein